MKVEKAKLQRIRNFSLGTSSSEQGEGTGRTKEKQLGALEIRVARAPASQYKPRRLIQCGVGQRRKSGLGQLVQSGQS